MLPFLIIDFCCGAHSPMECLLQEAIDEESLEISKKYDDKKLVYFIDYYESRIAYVNGLLLI